MSSVQLYKLPAFVITWHLIAFSQYCYALYYDRFFVHIPDDLLIPKMMRPTEFGGRSKFLTYWCLRRPRRRLWMRPMLLERDQNASQLVNSILEEEQDWTIVNFVRLSRADFDYILSIITPSIRRQDTYMRNSITAKDRLIVTLRYLASGDDYKSLEYAYRISQQSISLFIPEVCQHLIFLLRKYVKLPNTTEEWLRVSRKYEEKWGFPHAIGAIDGKHIAITAPQNSGTDYFNYKQFFSIVLLAVVDADYNFLYADVGCKGRISDGGVLRHSNLFTFLENKQLNIPEPAALDETSTVQIPYMLLGDSAFALKEYCMKPFGGVTERGSIQRIFNERHSRARRPVEQAFGILSGRFRVLRKPIKLAPNISTKVVLACVYLHNFIRRGADEETYDADVQRYSIGIGEESFSNLRGINIRSSDRLMQIRLHLANYFAAYRSEIE